MWRTSDGVVHTVAIPTEVPELKELCSQIERLSQEQRDKLDEQLMETTWVFADQLDLEPYDKDTEQQFVEVRLPIELVNALPWHRLLTTRLGDELQEIELRWRLDVIQTILQAIVDVEAK